MNERALLFCAGLSRPRRKSLVGELIPADGVTRCFFDNSPQKMNIGISLIELLIQMGVILLLLTLSLPFLDALYKKSEMQRISTLIQSSIYFTKTHALLQEKNLLLAPLESWSKGMVLLVDNKQHRYSPGTSIIQQWNWFSPTVQITWQGFRSRDYLIFSSQLRESAMNGHFLIKNGGCTQKVVINRFGHIKIIN